MVSPGGECTSTLAVKMSKTVFVYIEGLCRCISIVKNTPRRRMISNCEFIFPTWRTAEMSLVQWPSILAINNISYLDFLSQLAAIN